MFLPEDLGIILMEAILAIWVGSIVIMVLILVLEAMFLKRTSLKESFGSRENLTTLIQQAPFILTEYLLNKLRLGYLCLKRLGR